MEIKTMGVDSAKNVFRIHGGDGQGRSYSGHSGDGSCFRL